MTANGGNRNSNKSISANEKKDENKATTIKKAQTDRLIKKSTSVVCAPGASSSSSISNNTNSSQTSNTTTTTTTTTKDNKRRKRQFSPLESDVSSKIFRGAASNTNSNSSVSGNSPKNNNLNPGTNDLKKSSVNQELKDNTADNNNNKTKNSSSSNNNEKSDTQQIITTSDNNMCTKDKKAECTIGESTTSGESDSKPETKALTSMDDKSSDYEKDSGSSNKESQDDTTSSHQPPSADNINSKKSNSESTIGEKSSSSNALNQSQNNNPGDEISPNPKDPKNINDESNSTEEEKSPILIPESSSSSPSPTPTGDSSSSQKSNNTKALQNEKTSSSSSSSTKVSGRGKEIRALSKSSIKKEIILDPTQKHILELLEHRRMLLDRVQTCKKVASTRLISKRKLRLKSSSNGEEQQLGEATITDSIATLSQDALCKMEENEINEFREMTDRISQATASSLSAAYSSKKSRSLSTASAGGEKIDLTGENSFNDNKGHPMTSTNTRPASSRRPSSKKAHQATSQNQPLHHQNIDMNHSNANNFNNLMANDGKKSNYGYQQANSNVNRLEQDGINSPNNNMHSPLNNNIQNKRQQHSSSGNMLAPPSSTSAMNNTGGVPYNSKSMKQLQQSQMKRNQSSSSINSNANSKNLHNNNNLTSKQQKQHSQQHYGTEDLYPHHAYYSSNSNSSSNNKMKRQNSSSSNVHNRQMQQQPQHTMEAPQSLYDPTFLSLKEKRNALLAKLASNKNKNKNKKSSSKIKSSSSNSNKNDNKTSTPPTAAASTITPSSLQPSRLPPRPKTQWDYLLEEMQWLASDFMEERKWKTASAAVLSNFVKTDHASKIRNNIIMNSKNSRHSKQLQAEGGETGSKEKDDDEEERRKEMISSSIGENDDSDEKEQRTPPTTGEKTRSSSYSRLCPPTESDIEEVKVVAATLSSSVRNHWSALINSDMLIDENPTSSTTNNSDIDSKPVKQESSEGSTDTSTVIVKKEIPESDTKNIVNEITMKDADTNQEEEKIEFSIPSQDNFDQMTSRIQYITQSANEVSPKRRIPKLNCKDIGLTEYQEKAVNYIDQMWNLPANVILGDDEEGHDRNDTCGVSNKRRKSLPAVNDIIMDMSTTTTTGKTIAVCAALWKYRSKGPQLVICSSSSLLRWRHELRRFTDLRILTLGHEGCARSSSSVLSGDEDENHIITDLIENDVLLCDHPSLEMLNSTSASNGVLRTKWGSIILDLRYIIHPSSSSSFPSSFLKSRNWWDILFRKLQFENHEYQRKLVIRSTNSNLNSTSSAPQHENTEYFSKLLSFILLPSSSSPANTFYSPRRFVSWAKRTLKKNQSEQTSLHQDNPKHKNNTAQSNIQIQNMLREMLLNFQYSIKIDDWFDEDDYMWDILRCKMPEYQHSQYLKCCSNVRGALSSKMGINGRSSCNAILQLRKMCLHANIDNVLCPRNVCRKIERDIKCESFYDKTPINTAQPNFALAQEIFQGSSKCQELLRVLTDECHVKSMVEIIEEEGGGESDDSFTLVPKTEEVNLSDTTFVAQNLTSPSKRSSAKQDTSTAASIEKKIVILACMPEAQMLLHFFLSSCGISHEVMYTTKPHGEQEKEQHQNVRESTNAIYGSSGGVSAACYLASQWANSQRIIQRFDTNTTKNNSSSMSYYGPSILISSPLSVSGLFGSLSPSKADLIISFDDDWSGRSSFLVDSLLKRTLLRNKATSMSSSSGRGSSRRSGSAMANSKTKTRLIKLLTQDSCEESFFTGRLHTSTQKDTKRSSPLMKDLPAFSSLTSPDSDDESDDDGSSYPVFPRVHTDIHGFVTNMRILGEQVLDLRDKLLSDVLHAPNLPPNAFNGKELIFFPFSSAKEQISDDKDMNAVKRVEQERWFGRELALMEKSACPNSNDMIRTGCGKIGFSMNDDISLNCYSLSVLILTSSEPTDLALFYGRKDLSFMQTRLYSISVGHQFCFGGSNSSNSNSANIGTKTNTLSTMDGSSSSNLCQLALNGNGEINEVTSSNDEKVNSKELMTENVADMWNKSGFGCSPGNQAVPLLLYNLTNQHNLNEQEEGEQQKMKKNKKSSLPYKHLYTSGFATYRCNAYSSSQIKDGNFGLEPLIYGPPVFPGLISSDNDNTQHKDKKPTSSTEVATSIPDSLAAGGTSSVVNDISATSMNFSENFDDMELDTAIMGSTSNNIPADLNLLGDILSNDFSAGLDVTVADTADLFAIGDEGGTTTTGTGTNNGGNLGDLPNLNDIAPTPINVPSSSDAKSTTGDMKQKQKEKNILARHDPVGFGMLGSGKPPLWAENKKSSNAGMLSTVTETARYRYWYDSYDSSPLATSLNNDYDDLSDFLSSGSHQYLDLDSVLLFVKKGENNNMRGSISGGSGNSNRKRKGGDSSYNMNTTNSNAYRRSNSTQSSSGKRQKKQQHQHQSASGMESHLWPSYAANEFGLTSMAMMSQHQQQYDGLGELGLRNKVISYFEKTFNEDDNDGDISGNKDEDSKESSSDKNITQYVVQQSCHEDENGALHKVGDLALSLAKTQRENFLSSDIGDVVSPTSTIPNIMLSRRFKYARTLSEKDYSFQPWTKMEDSELLRLASRLCFSWPIIACTLSSRGNPGGDGGILIPPGTVVKRSAVQCHDRWNFLQQQKDNKSSTPLSSDVVEPEVLFKDLAMKHETVTEGLSTILKDASYFHNFKRSRRVGSKSIDENVESSPSSAMSSAVFVSGGVGLPVINENANNSTTATLERINSNNSINTNNKQQQKQLHMKKRLNVILTASSKRQNARMNIPGYNISPENNHLIKIEPSHSSHEESVRKMPGNTHSPDWPLPIIQIFDEERNQILMQRSNAAAAAQQQQQAQQQPQMRVVSQQQQQQSVQHSRSSVPMQQQQQQQQYSRPPPQRTSTVSYTQQQPPQQQQQRHEQLKQAARAAALSAPSSTNVGINSRPSGVPSVPAPVMRSPQPPNNNTRNVAMQQQPVRTVQQTQPQQVQQQQVISTNDPLAVHHHHHHPQHPQQQPTQLQAAPPLALASPGRTAITQPSNIGISPMRPIHTTNTNLAPVNNTQLPPPQTTQPQQPPMPPASK